MNNKLIKKTNRKKISSLVVGVRNFTKDLNGDYDDDDVDDCAAIAHEDLFVTPWPNNFRFPWNHIVWWNTFYRIKPIFRSPLFSETHKIQTKSNFSFHSRTIKCWRFL